MKYVLPHQGKGITRGYYYGCYKTFLPITQTFLKSENPVSSRPSSKYCGIGGLAMIPTCVCEEKYVNRRGGTQDSCRSLCTYSLPGIPYESLCSMGSGNGPEVHYACLPSVCLATPPKGVNLN